VRIDSKVMKATISTRFYLASAGGTCIYDNRIVEKLQSRKVVVPCSSRETTDFSSAHEKLWLFTEARIQDLGWKHFWADILFVDRVLTQEEKHSIPLGPLLILVDSYEPLLSEWYMHRSQKSKYPGRLTGNQNK
jgi:hypothetical protein